MHNDLAGPSDPVAKYGFRYVISFTDDFSGCFSNAVKATKRLLADIALYGRMKYLNFCDYVFLLEKLDVSEVIVRENIYQKTFGTLLHHTRFTKMAQQKEIGSLFLI